MSAYNRDGGVRIRMHGYAFGNICVGGSLPWFLEAFMLETSASQSQPQAQYTKETGYPSSYKVTTIICPICDAVYAPSHLHSSFLLIPSEALESAFMSMCHFCFRCRRPSCPQCWDGVHGVCGDCVRQTHLSFRTQAVPLNGMRFPPLPLQETPYEEVSSSLLVCMKPGRFQQEAVLANGVTIEAVKTTEKISDRLPESREDVVMWLPAKQPQPVTEPVAVAEAAQMEDDDEVRGGEAGEERAQPPHPVLRVFRVLERVLTVLALVALLAIIALVALAQYSDAANTLIIQVLHIDIRAEVAYLVHIMQQLH